MTIQTPTPFAGPQRVPEQVAFDRSELSIILTLYGRMVAAGEWRDYGLSCLRDVAVFSIFRRTAEHPTRRRLASRRAPPRRDGDDARRGHLDHSGR